MELQSGIWKSQPSIIRPQASILLFPIETLYVFLVVKQILCLGMDSVSNFTQRWMS